MTVDIPRQLKNLLETNDLDYKSLIFSSDIEGDEKNSLKIK